MKETKYHYTILTNKEVEQVIEDLENILKEEKFGVLWRFDFHKKFEEKGLTLKEKITVLEVCNPYEASGILEIDPLASYLLPCKITIIKNEKDTKIGLLKPSILFDLVENEKLKAIAKVIEQKLIDAIGRSV